MGNDATQETLIRTCIAPGTYHFDSITNLLLDKTSSIFRRHDTRWVVRNGCQNSHLITPLHQPDRGFTDTYCRSRCLRWIIWCNKEYMSHITNSNYQLCAMRTAASPSPNGLCSGGSGLGLSTALTMSCQRVPTRTFHPASTVSTHSVSSRSVTQGTLRRKASFCSPPESVRIR